MAATFDQQKTNAPPNRKVLSTQYPLACPRVVTLYAWVELQDGIDNAGPQTLPYLFGTGSFFWLLVISNADEARKPQGNAFLCIHLSRNA
jgi:hypothetical protein